MHSCILNLMPKRVKRARESTGGDSNVRLAQRNRTRNAIVEAAMRLLAAGRTPSIAEVVKEAEVSRRTVYMYFPTVEQLLLDATLGALSANRMEPVLDVSRSGDSVARAEELSRAVNELSGSTMHLGRALIRLTVEAAEPRDGAPRRGYRRIEWIERAFEALRRELGRKEFERMVSALSVVMGWEPLIVLKDVRGLEQKDAEDVLAFAARAIVGAAVRTRG